MIANAKDLNWVTIATFADPQDVMFLGHRLREEGVPFQVLDGNTVQVAPYLSNTLGGVRLQVLSADVGVARSILKVFRPDTQLEPAHGPILQWFELRTRHLPWAGRLETGPRLLMIGGFLIVAVVLLVMWFLQPDKRALLRNTAWCAHALYIEGDEVEFETIEPMRLVTLECTELVRFFPSGSCWLPGFGSARARMHWALEGETLSLTALDSIGSVYAGQYNLEVDGRHLILTSERVRLIAYPDRTIDHVMQGMR